MTDGELERRVQVAELLIEAGYEDLQNGVMTRDQVAIHSRWVLEVLLKDLPDEVVRAVAEYEIYIVSEMT